MSKCIYTLISRFARNSTPFLNTPLPFFGGGGNTLIALHYTIYKLKEYYINEHILLKVTKDVVIVDLVLCQVPEETIMQLEK